MPTNPFAFLSALLFLTDDAQRGEVAAGGDPSIFEAVFIHVLNSGVQHITIGPKFVSLRATEVQQGYHSTYRVDPVKEHVTESSTCALLWLRVATPPSQPA